MQIFLLLAFVVALLLLLRAVVSSSKRQPTLSLPAGYREILEQHVLFFRALTAKEKIRFENKMAAFMSTIQIEGVHTNVEDIDRVFIAASAVIPIFAFTAWQYPNLTTVLLYPERFNSDFDFQQAEKPVLGMVGSGPMNYKMILSKPALREGFLNESDKNNTAIHEFVHLLDKIDGAVDGVPSILLKRQYSLPWLDLVHQEIKKIVASKSDINPYGATNKAEFFAVAAEYFFEQPQLFSRRHPALFAMMEEIFNQHPGTANRSEQPVNAKE